MSRTKPATVAQYISAAPRHAQKSLREIRAILKKVAPKALIRKIAAYRLKQVREEDARWMY